MGLLMKDSNIMNSAVEIPVMYEVLKARKAIWSFPGVEDKVFREAKVDV